ncbi:hypothetical protein, partial [Methanosarcina sp. KYL-1]|uniref:hypothetical protein n=1 Tax=Methanosarcina sp. KYL-1 TaxID=2602068 RepID=UPI002100C48E
EMGVGSIANLEKAVVLYDEAQNIFPKTGSDYAYALVNEGNARKALAEMGVGSIANLEKAVVLYDEAQKIFPKTSSSFSFALITESNARQTLAEMGVDSKENLETAIHLCEIALEILTKTSSGYSVVLVNESNARLGLAEMGIDSRDNLETAIRHCRTAQKILPKTSSDYALALMNEGNARLRLAEMGINSKENLKTVIVLYGDAREIFPKKSAEYALVLMNEGNARKTLSEMGIDSKKNLETAVYLYRAAQEMFPNTSSNYALALMNESTARLRQAEMGIDSKKNLEIAVHLCRFAREIFPNTSSNYALALDNEGNARLRLADMDIDSKKNLEIAVHLYRAAQKIIPKTSPYYAGALMKEGCASQGLEEISVNSNYKFENSKKLLLRSISILEELGDGWRYSIALLNFNRLLKDNFYKTGDEKHLEEWERNLGDIEEKIKDRDIRYKELVMARIHEIRASLFEFEGKSGINKASREYDKAYELSKDPFYKFMDEFCQARIDTKYFCELVSGWEEIEKKGIFLDYYDYTVFECHLENALKSTIDEEDELKLAVEKLTEIRDRTQIKIIKDRVSAYIYLLQALVDCFTKESYTEAAENVKLGCKIFRECGDEQGQQMCEIFHNAVVKKRDPNAWQDIIRNREFSSNFYSLLCEYSDRKRVDMESYKLDHIYETVNRTEEKVDKLQVTLNQGFSEIKDQIEDGFNGTVSELREIKGEINSIQRDLEGLLQVSNEINSKEGERVREFVTEILALMKKGDSEALNRFLEEIVQKEPSFAELIENSDAPEKDKEEAKSKLSGFKKVAESVNEKIISFGKNVTNEIFVDLTAGEIIKLLTPMMSMAAFGVPIPSQVVEILAAVTKGLVK